ncbi:MAG TPA: hypothetical protein VGC32_13890 [Solirubrobacterales bacterium]
MEEDNGFVPASWIDRFLPRCLLPGGSGFLEAVPGWFLPHVVQLDDYKNVLWIMPVVLLLGALAAFLLKERTPGAPTGAADAAGPA